MQLVFQMYRLFYGFTDHIALQNHILWQTKSSYAIAKKKKSYWGIW